MAKEDEHRQPESLPESVAEFINSIIKKIWYRRRVREEVQAELSAHFEDELHGCADEEEKQKLAQQLVSQFAQPKVLATLIRRAKKRCRPMWKKALVRSLQVLGVILLYLVVCLGYLGTGKPTIKVNYVEWLNNLVRASRDESLNAKSYFDKAAQLVDKHTAWPEILWKSSSEWPGDMNDPQRQAVIELVAKNTEAFAVLREAVKRPHYWVNYDAKRELLPQEVFDGIEKHDIRDNYRRGWFAYYMSVFMYDDLKRLTEYRTLARALATEAVWKAYCGDVESALDDAVVLQKFGMHLEGKGLLTEQLVGIAIEALAHGRMLMVLDRADVSADVLKKVQGVLEQLCSRQDPPVSFEAEKAFWYDYVQRTFTDDGRGGGRVLKNGMPLVVGDWKDGLSGLLTFNYPDRRQVMEMVDRFYAEAERLVSVPPWQARSEAPDDRLNDIARDSVFLRMSAPGCARASTLTWRVRTHRQALQTVVAVLRYQKEKGRRPADLAEVVTAGYLNELPADPYSGGPLGYRLTNGGFLLYSVGANLKDDGGRSGIGSKGQPRMWADNGDWVFWPVAK